MNWIALNPMGMYQPEPDWISILLAIIIPFAIVAGVTLWIFFRNTPVFSVEQEKRINELIEKKLKEA